MRTAMSASRRSRLLSWFEATSSIAMPGCSACKVAISGGNSQVAATSLVVMRTVPLSALLARARPCESASAPASIWRAASAIASAATVGVTPRPVRSNSGAPSCASSSVT